LKKNRLTRLRRGRDSESPPATSSRRKAIVESSDDDLDEGRQQGTGLPNLWDDDRRGDDEEEEGDMDTDSFIEYSDEDEGAGGNEEAREERRREKKQDAERRKRARRVRPELAGIDAKCVSTDFSLYTRSSLRSAWDEIMDVFGDGHEYDWALVGEDEMEFEEELKPEMKYQDVSHATFLSYIQLTMH